MAPELDRAMARPEVVVTRLGRAIGPGRLTKRGDLWVLDYRAGDGRRVREALSSDRKVAERMRAQRITQRDLELAGLGSVEGQSRPLNEIRDLYIADLEARATPRYLLHVRQRIDDVLREIRAPRACDLRPFDVIQLRLRWRASGASPVTANHKVDSVRSMLNWAVRAGVIAENPIKHLPKLPEKESTRVHRRRAMTEAEIDAFLDAAQEDDRAAQAQLEANEPRDAARTAQGEVRQRGIRVPQAPFWRALVETGCRYGELRKARWSDVDLDGRTLDLRPSTTKSGRARRIPLLDGLVSELRAVRDVQAIALRRPLRLDDCVFMTPAAQPLAVPSRNALRIFDRLLVAAEIDRVNAAGEKLDIHALRHTACSRLLRNDVPLQKVQALLGHADARMTSRVYAHMQAQDLRDAVETIEQSAIARKVRRDAS